MKTILLQLVRAVALIAIILAAPSGITAAEAWTCAAMQDHYGFECVSCADYGECAIADGFVHVWMCCNDDVCYVDGDYHSGYPGMHCAE